MTDRTVQLADRTPNASDTAGSRQVSETDGRTVLGSFPAGAPRGSWPAEEFAAARRAEGINATVVMNIDTDTFNVVKAVTV